MCGWLRFIFVVKLWSAVNRKCSSVRLYNVLVQTCSITENQDNHNAIKQAIISAILNLDENVTYEELMRRTVIDKKRNVGMRLLPLTDKAPNVRVVSKAPTKARKIDANNSKLYRQKGDVR